jgi:circadian clock protein KaiC
MARIMLNLGWDATELLESGNFELMYSSPVEMQVDAVAAQVFERVRAGKVKRIVIDALGDLERGSIDRQRLADFIYALTRWFAVENVTCMLMSEVHELFEVHQVSDQEISNMSDNLVLLGYTSGEEMKRTIRVIKTRGSTHDNRLHLLEISDKGAVVRKSK